MVANILIARFTKMKYIFLTGHHHIIYGLYVCSNIIAGGITGTPVVIIGSLLLGFIMASMPAMAQPFHEKNYRYR